MQFVSRIWKTLAGDRRLMFCSVACGLAFTALGIIPPLLIREMLLWLREPTTARSFWLLEGRSVLCTCCEESPVTSTA